MRKIKAKRTSELNDEGAIEDVLKPLSEDEGDHVAEMHAVARRSTSSVEVEGLALLIAVEDEVELAAKAEQVESALGARFALSLLVESSPVREEGATAEEHVRFPSSETLEAGEQLLVNLLGPEIVDEMIVVDGHLAKGEKEYEHH